jgi:thioredoxin reductase (NADPH)
MVGENVNFDVIIVGAGPAGLSAAIWCSDVGLSSVVLEKGPEKGGQLLHIYNQINNYPGCSASEGPEFRDDILKTLSNCRATFVHGADVIDIDTESMTVEVARGQKYTGKKVIFASGVRRRRLGIPGESEFEGKGILVSGARDRTAVSGKTVAIIGGGDAALENSLILAENADHVYVIHRRGDLRARKKFVDTAAKNSRIEFILSSEVTAIKGGQKLESIDLKDQRTDATSSLSIDRLLIRIGVEPNSELVNDKCELDDAGYVVVDRVGRSSIPGIYAVGDVANPVSPTIATSVGTGAAAVKDIASTLRR